MRRDSAPPRMVRLLLAALALAGCGPRYDPTLIVLPEGYRGPLVVIFDRPEGGAAVREDGRRLIRADSAGVALTAFPLTYGRVDDVYVSERDDGWCLYPPYHVSVAGRYPLCSDSVRVWGRGTGALLADDGTGTFSSDAEGTVAFASYYVGTVAEAESLRVRASPFDDAEIVRRRLSERSGPARRRAPPP